MLSEIQTYLERLEDRRAAVLKTLDGLEITALEWRPLPADVNSLAALGIHCLGAERRWLHEVVGGNKIERDREAEFRARAEDVTSLHALYAAAALESRGILKQLTKSDLDAVRPLPRESRTVRWCILHIIEHYSEHLGQMLLTRQLWENKHVRPHEI